MKKMLARTCALLASLLLALSCAACAAFPAGTVSSPDPASPGAYSARADGSAVAGVSEDGEYASKDEVALYVHLYGHLPGNYVSKTKARAAGWVSTEGNLWDVLPGKSIGGSRFYDDDGQLPDAPGRCWTECDVDYAGGYRNGKRLVFSNDGLIYYTGDHYRTFERLY